MAPSSTTASAPLFGRYGAALSGVRPSDPPPHALQVLAVYLAYLEAASQRPDHRCRSRQDSHPIGRGTDLSRNQ